MWSLAFSYFLTLLIAYYTPRPETRENVCEEDDFMCQFYFDREEKPVACSFRTGRVVHCSFVSDWDRFFNTDINYFDLMAKQLELWERGHNNSK